MCIPHRFSLHFLLSQISGPFLLPTFGLSSEDSPISATEISTTQCTTEIIMNESRDLKGQVDCLVLRTWESSLTFDRQGTFPSLQTLRPE